VRLGCTVEGVRLGRAVEGVRLGHAVEGVRLGRAVEGAAEGVVRARESEDQCDSEILNTRDGDTAKTGTVWHGYAILGTVPAPAKPVVQPSGDWTR